mgnify:CR=1 FL=1
MHPERLKAKQLQGDRMLPSICQDVHMALTGASDRYEELKQDLWILQTCLKHWKEPSSEFDVCVNQMMRCVLAKARRSSHADDLFNTNGLIE